MTRIDPDIATWVQRDAETIRNYREAAPDKITEFGLRELIKSMPIVGDKNYITVDTKVAYLMPGMSPSIPGWHTDGIPRGDSLHPRDKGVPNLEQHMKFPEAGPRYHLYTSGWHCPTEFIVNPMQLEIPEDIGRDLYAHIDRKIEANKIDPWLETLHTNPAHVYTWDSWNIHRALSATHTGWRLLVRVCECDVLAPRDEGYIRTQNQVYVTRRIGW
ncbi:hypothetical protein PXH69_24620 [Rhodococcus qingshengii]|uniref:Phytanoyl-CoA dioxygenase family protein n=1 Tax=Rhodococcus qingshengii TaxID=334542 RepID=A0AAW6LSC0_RHOSG|nr:hypothetical protein [Rhodococcus qingshengii]MDE8648156.1 hypothetical protein [Rhodococcus qingshengii]